MSGAYRVDPGAAFDVVQRMSDASERVGRDSVRLAAALSALVDAASGSPQVASALDAFAERRTTIAPAVSQHLAVVAAAGSAAVSAVTDADAAMAARTPS